VQQKGKERHASDHHVQTTLSLYSQQ